MKRVLTSIAALLSAVTALPAAAAPTVFEPVSYTFDFTGKNTNTNPAYGNTLSETVGGITATVSAWSIDRSIGTPFNSHGTPSSLNLQPAKLVEYQGLGLGVTDVYESGAAPYHTVDNVGAYDFLMFSFSQPVQLLFGNLVPFSVNGPADNDSWVSFNQVAPGSTPLADPAVFANMMLHATEVKGNLNSGQDFSTYLNPGMNTGFSWIVGADAFSNAVRNDGFKLAAFSVQLPVPEPATWASMILGIGLAGAMLRRRPKTAVLA